MKEKKQEICNLLVPVLRATKNLSDVKSLTYIYVDDYTHYVRAEFENGYSKVANVSMDSGTSMIRDIIAGIL